MQGTCGMRISLGDIPINEKGKYSGLKVCLAW